MRNKILAVALSAIMMSSMCALTACGSKNKAEDQAYVSLDINPAIELVVDKDNNVVSVRGENEDGQVLLYNEAGIKGEKIDVAIEKITNLAIEYGYLDENNKVVDTLVTSNSDSFAKKITEKVNTTVTATAGKTGLTVKTDGEGAYSLLRRMEEFKKEHPNDKAIQNMSVAKFKLALSVSETGEITLEVAVTLDESQLMAKLKEQSEKIEEFATEAYRQAKTQALAAYDKAIDLAVYGVYTAFYAKRSLTKPATAYYGSMYCAYATAAKSLDLACDVAESVATARTYPLTEEQIAAVVAALGLENADPIKNSKGEVTIESIEAYADKQFKNTEASAKLEETKAKLTEALNKTEADIKAKVNEFTEEYAEQIEATVNAANAAIAAIDAWIKVLPEDVQAEIANAESDIKAIITDLSTIIKNGGKIEISDVRAKADKLEGKANDYLNKINKDLTDDERAELEKNKTDVVNKMTIEKKKMEDALTKAETEAKKYLEKLKAERKENKE